MAQASLGDADYRKLLVLRTRLRRFLHWSETEAQAVGLTPAHHQLLLAIRGHDDPRGPTIGDVAGYLLLRHHSAVELVQRAAAFGLVARAEDPDDRRVVRLSLTAKGAAALEKLTSLHLEELSRLADEFRPLWQGHLDDAWPDDDPGMVRPGASSAGAVPRGSPPPRRPGSARQAPPSAHRGG